MKKIISLILVVLLCLPSVFVTVSAEGADTYTITAASGADTTSNDYLNINKYLVYYDGGDTLSIPANYITVAQWKANIANPAINANGVADDAYITDDCTLTLTMDDGTTTKTVAIDAVDYVYMYKEYDKKSTTTMASLNLAKGNGSNGSSTAAVEQVNGDEYGFAFTWKPAATDTGKSRWHQFAMELKNVKKDMTTPYIIETTLYADAPSTKNATLLFLYGGSQQAQINNETVKEKVLSGEPFTITAHIFPKALRADYYVDGELIRENLSLTAVKSGVDTDYNNHFTAWGLRLVNDTAVSGEYKESKMVITDFAVKYGYGNFDSELYIEPTIDITSYKDGDTVKIEDLVNVGAVTNSADYNTAELYVNGKKAATQTITGKSVSFSSSLLKAGDNELEVIMYENSKNPVSSGKITVTVEGTVTIDGLTDGSTVHEDDFTGIIKAVANDAGYEKAELYIDDSLIEEAWFSDKEVYFFSDALSLGEHKIEVRAYPAKGDYISETITIRITDLTTSETFEISDTADADTASNDYINIKKYLAYYDGGEELNIPADYITVGQWKANIANPAINAEGLSDADYITSACTLTWTALDGVTTKTVYINAVDYNYMFKEYDKKAETTFASNDLGLSWTKGSKATVTAGNKDMSDGDYALTMDTSVPNDATSMQGYVNILQTLSGINEKNSPYSVNMTFVPENSDSLWKFNVGFINTTNNGRAGKDLPGSAASAFKTGDKFDVSIMVYPAAKVFDVYVNGSIALENQSTEDTGNNQGYADYKQLYFRFYNGTKVGDVYENLTFAITDYDVRYGFGNIGSEIYVAPTVDITNYTDGAKVTTENIVPVEAVTNNDNYKTAVLYIDGVKADEAAVSNKTATLDASSMGYGDHEVEVRMYPEIGEYISETVTVSVLDMVEISDYTITFDEFDAGETPAGIAKPADYFGKTTFINYSNESLEDSTVIVNDAYVEYYDDVRGNVFHTKADQNSNTDKSGRRIEILQSSTSNNMAVSFDMYFESFSGTGFSFLETRGTGVNSAVSMGADGLLTMSGTTTSGTTSIQLETGRWYTIEADFYCTMGGVVKLRVYNEDGSLVGSMESVNGAPYTDRVRIYTPYNKDNLQSGEAYIDNVKTTIISSTGSIGEITATVDDLYTVSAVMNGVSKVDSVEITNADGDVELLGYVYDAENSVLTISTSRPLEVTDTYTLSVYADGYAVPMTSGFVLAGGCIKVTDSYFNTQRGKNYVVLNVANTTDKEGKVTVLVSEWDGEKLISMKAKTIAVAIGEDEYSVEITGNVDNTKVMPVSSLAKPILLSNGVITK